jgi:hypothetical protein
LGPTITKKGNFDGLCKQILDHFSQKGNFDGLYKQFWGSTFLKKEILMDYISNLKHQLNKITKKGNI